MNYETYQHNIMNGNVFEVDKYLSYGFTGGIYHFKRGESLKYKMNITAVIDLYS